MITDKEFNTYREVMELQERIEEQTFIQWQKGKERYENAFRLTDEGYMKNYTDEQIKEIYNAIIDALPQLDAQRELNVYEYLDFDRFINENEFEKARQIIYYGTELISFDYFLYLYRWHYWEMKYPKSTKAQDEYYISIIRPIIERIEK